MIEHHVTIERTARYWTRGPSEAADLWIVLHGYKQLARRFLRRFEPIDDGTRLIVAPEALSRFYISVEPGRHGPTSVVGATWMTREDRETEIRDYVAYLDRLLERVRDEHHTRLTVLGFSQGVATASRWVTLGSARPDRLILWGDTSPPDLDVARASEALDGVDVVLVRGDEDRALAPRLVDEERERLTAASIEYRMHAYGGGHDIDPDALQALARQS